MRARTLRRSASRAACRCARRSRVSRRAAPRAPPADRHAPGRRSTAAVADRSRARRRRRDAPEKVSSLKYLTPMHPNGVRGWLLVLCLLLVIWQPLSVAIVVSSMVNRLAIRGLPLALVLLLRLLVTAFGIAAGIALFARRPAAVAMAKASLVASAAVDVFVYVTPYAP